MPSWVIVGAARGIGFEFVNQLSANSNNQVVAIIRNQSTASVLNALAEQRPNIHVLETDIFSPDSLREAVAKVEKVTKGALDVLIHNAYSAGTEAMFWTPSQFTGKETELHLELTETIKANVIGPILTINALLPLIHNGNEKKLIYITSGAGDVDMTRKSRLAGQIGYSASKAGGNVVMAKYAGELADEGIKTISISPGWVETPATEGLTANPAVLEYLLSAFKRLDPDVAGMIKVEESVKAQLEVIARLDAESSGAFVSHHGDKKWVD
ncbi:hypothetical protein B0A48_18756 [Cryoendolithus antarcticus]|uniref:NAD(P)-binding protein n=1 Tax=Cryoendolithus antarcticus TaxID=1507870 RepID=A0A1V8S7Q4_9PEZI|nr:hypothetical protein B0A48_18756 [Cryoendolithus antarcticus]